MIVLPALLLTTGAAGVSIKRARHDHATYLTQLATATASELAAKIELIGLWVETRADDFVDATLPGAAASGLGPDEIAAELIRIDPVAAVVLIREGAAAFIRESPSRPGATLAPIDATNTKGVISAIGKRPNGGSLIRLDFIKQGWPARTQLRVYLDAVTPRATPTSDTHFQLLYPTITPTPNKAPHHISASSRISGHDLHVQYELPHAAADNGTLGAAMVSFAAVLLMSMLIAARAARHYLTDLRLVQTRIGRIIRVVDPAWRGNIDSSEALTQVLDKLEDVVHCQAERLGRDSEEQQQRFRAIQDQMLNKASLAKVGEFAHEIMHDIGQPLTVLKNLAEDLEYELGEKDQTPIANRTVKRMTTAVARITRIHDTIRTHARPPTQGRKTIDLVQLVEGTHDMLSYRTRRLGIRFDHISVVGNPILVNGNPTEIEQCLTNILSNAIEALQTTSGMGKHVKVSASEDGEWANMVVEDNGPGIDPAVLSKVFEKGFTTKPEGTGFGLGTCRRFIEEHHHGQLLIESSVGVGTKVTIKLPRHDPELDAS